MGSRSVNEPRKQLAKAALDTPDTSGHALLSLLKRIKASNSLSEIRRLSDQLERVIFHKQFQNG